ncbi:unnamed protein product, partial [Amoebophrya sp. A25]
VEEKAKQAPPFASAALAVTMPPPDNVFQVPAEDPVAAPEYHTPLEDNGHTPRFPSGKASKHSSKNNSKKTASTEDTNGEEGFIIDIPGDDPEAALQEGFGVLLEDAIAGSMGNSTDRNSAVGAARLEQFRRSIWRNLPFHLPQHKDYLRFRYADSDFS